MVSGRNDSDSSPRPRDPKLGALTIRPTGRSSFAKLILKENTC